MNMDSLHHAILHSETYSKSSDQKSIKKPFQKFENSEKDETYNVCLDSNGRFFDYINVAVIYKKFDSEGRIIKRIGYDLRGNYSLLDCSPIEISQYIGDSIIHDYYNSLYEQTERTISIEDSKHRIIDYISYDKNLELVKHQSTKYNDNQIVITTKDSNGNLYPNSSGAAITEITMDLKDNTIIQEIKFYTVDHFLIDAEHSHFKKTTDLPILNPGIPYSIVKFNREKGSLLFQYFNSLGNLVCDMSEDGSIVFY